MAKIVIIGAGGHVFPLRLVGDVLSHVGLLQSHICLMDINPDTLKRTSEAILELVAHHQLPTQISSTTDRREALSGADYILITFQVGGLEAYRLDVEIPRKYGIDQTVGDTLGPGGVMRFLRSSVALKEIAEDILALCPKATVINYANPMAMNCWYLQSLGVNVVGLCHSVQNTTHMLAKHLGLPYEEVHYKSAGINHQAWILEFRHQGEDLLPKVRSIMRREHLERTTLRAMAKDTGDHSQHKREWTVYEGGQEQVRTWLMDTFGYFHTESSHHASEYVPWFRKSPEAVMRFIPERWDYYQVCRDWDESEHVELLNNLKTELVPSLEYGSWIIHAMETGEPAVVYANVSNDGLIENLPNGCCVEVPCLVDKNGVQPTHIGKLPTQLAALNRTNINVQELAVEAALTGKVERVYQAIALDPLSSALLDLRQLSEMTTELLQSEQAYLPKVLRLEPHLAVAADD